MPEIKRFICIHGHFYQPPRENPWLDFVEVEDSAYPYHDWNERITRECYAANSVARVLDAKKEIIEMKNNYKYISFNFGPTLLYWLEKNAPDTYRAILDADKYSMDRNNGHGNAIAQVYSHLIMPLATKKDKITQIKWGIEDFKIRFGRFPEGMWLAETAVDKETLELMAKEGIKFTILSPSQAKKIRAIGTQEWIDVTGEKIDTLKPYIYRIDDKLSIVIFFYNGEISRAIAFGGLLNSGDNFVQALLSAFRKEREDYQLVNVATDGESYGHHHKFGEMALSYAIDKIMKNKNVGIINYGYFLEISPPKYEVEIIENSSWSCAHGVGRWKEDCGCHISNKPGWNQKWREPLRKSLNWLRDELDEIFEREGKRYFKDNWEARNNYIEVILNRTPENIDNFLKKNCIKELNYFEQLEAISLLEMERNRILMFTSCGWFFDDPSGIETVQILKYASRAIELSRCFTTIDLEQEFVDRLTEIKSNIPEEGTGRDIYFNKVLPSKADIDRIVAHYCILSLFNSSIRTGEHRLYAYLIEPLDWNMEQYDSTRLVMGNLRITSLITTESREYHFAVLHFGGHDFNCYLKAGFGKVDYIKLKKTIFEVYEKLSITEVITALKEYFEGKYFTLRDLFVEERRRILSIVIKDVVERLESTYLEFYGKHKKLINYLYDSSYKMPDSLAKTIEFALTTELLKHMEAIRNGDFSSFDEIKGLLELSKKREIPVIKDKVVPLIETTIKELIESFIIDGELKKIKMSLSILELVNKYSINIDLWYVQNIVFEQYQQIVEKLNGYEYYLTILFQLLGISPSILNRSMGTTS